MSEDGWEQRMATKAAARRDEAERLPEPDDGRIHLHGTLVVCVCGAETGMTTVAFDDDWNPTECEICGKPVDRWGDSQPWRRVECHELGCVCHPETERCQLCGGVMVSGSVYEGDNAWHFGCSPGVVAVREGETLDQAEERTRDLDEGVARLRGET